MGISAQGTKLYIAGTSTSPKTITAISSTFPAIVTAAAHGYQNGDYVTIAGVTSTTGINTGWVVKNKTTNTFAVDFDATGTTPGVAGSPTATGTAWTVISLGTSLKGLDGSAKEIDTTTHDSTATEMILGLQDNGNMSLDIDGNNADAGQVALQAAKVDGLIRTFKYVLPAGAQPTCTFQAFVKKWDMAAAVNDKYKRTLELRISGPVTFS